MSDKNPFVQAADLALYAGNQKTRTLDHRKQDFRALFNTPAGERVIADIMSKSGLFVGEMKPVKGQKWERRSAEELASLEGQRTLALWIIQQLQT